MLKRGADSRIALRSIRATHWRFKVQAGLPLLNFSLIAEEKKQGALLRYRRVWIRTTNRSRLAISHNEIYTQFVHVITRKRLQDFAARHRDAAEPLAVWYAIMAKTDFGSFAEIRRVFGSADKVGKFTVFDISGNKYRLIAAIHYNRKKVYIRHVLTHAEYDRDRWQE